MMTNDLLTAIFAEMLSLRYGEKNAEAAATMARFARLTLNAPVSVAVPKRPYRKRKSAPPSSPETAQDGAAGVGSVVMSAVAPAAADPLEIPEMLRRVPQ